MKRIIYFATLLFLLVSTTAVQAATLIETTDKESKYQFISWLCDDAYEIDVNREKAVTREEFIKLAVNLFHIDNYEGQNTSFTDIKSGLKPVLENAVGTGLISDGTYFRPEDEITLAECLKILLTATKCDVEVPYFGGYPAGYLKVANDIDVTKGVTVTAENTLMPKDVYALIYNMLLAPKLEMTLAGQNCDYEYSATETNLSYIWDIYCADGIMNGNEYGIFGTKASNEIKGIIQVDGVGYEVEEDYNHLLGYDVLVYYSEDYGFRKAEYIVKYENEEIELLPSDEPEYKNGIIEYIDEKGKIKKLKLDSSCDYIYNGKAHYGMTADKIIPQTGTINLIDNNGDGKYDVVDVSSYYYMVVDNVDLYNEIIYGVNSPDNKINFSDDSTIKIYNKSEQQYVSPATIGAESLLAVEVSDDKTLFSVIILDEAVSGKITSQSDEYLELEGVRYELSAYFKDKIGQLSNIALGVECSVSIGLFNDVVAVENINGVMTYAYCIKAWEDDGGENYYLKVYTEDGKLIKSELADKVSIDSNSSVKKNIAYNQIGGNNITPQVMRIMFNNDNKIVRIDLEETTTDIKTCLDTETKDPYNNLIKYDISISSNVYRHGVIYPYFYVNGSKVMCVPMSNELNNDIGYGMGYSWVNDTNYSSNFTAYNVDSNGKPEFILLQGAPKNIFAQETQAMIVEKTMIALNPEDEVGILVSGWNNGNYVELFLTENVNITKFGESGKLVPGDVFRYTVDTRGFIDNIVVDFCAFDNNGNICLKQNTDTEALFNTGTGIVHYELGTVYSKASSNMYLYDAPNDKYINVVPPQKFIEFNLTTRALRPMSYNEVLSRMNTGDDSDFILVRQHYRYSQIGFIYTR